MPNIVANTDFTGDIFIQKDMDGVIAGLLDSMIALKEPEFLRQAMGNTVYNLFIAGNATAGRWKEIVDGVAYVVNENDMAIPPIKTYIAHYIYYWWMRNQATQSTGMVETVASVENATAVNNKTKMMSAFNAASKYLSEGMGCDNPIYGGLWYMLLYRVDDNGDRVYPEFKLSNANVRHFPPLNTFNI